MSHNKGLSKSSIKKKNAFKSSGKLRAHPYDSHAIKFSFGNGIFIFNLKKQDTLKIDGGTLETMLPSFFLTMSSILI